MNGVLDRVRGALVGLKMPRALEALDHTLHRLEQGEITALEAIDILLSEEYSTRETRRIDVALKTARLVPIKTLEGFDFSFQPSIDRERVAALAQLDFIRRAEVVHFLGPPGTGKSHLATALGVAAVKAGRSVYRATLAELVEALSKAEQEGRLSEKIRFYARASLLIVDDVFDTGRSIEAIIDQLQQRARLNTPADIRVAVPYYKPSRNEVGREPEYFLHATDAWLKYPHSLEGLSNEEIAEHRPELYRILSPHLETTKEGDRS